jgi:putative flippase GtrA
MKWLFMHKRGACQSMKSLTLPPDKNYMVLFVLSHSGPCSHLLINYLCSDRLAFNHNAERWSPNNLVTFTTGIVVHFVLRYWWQLHLAMQCTQVAPGVLSVM